jgi:serine/threonine-protein kinase
MGEVLKKFGRYFLLDQVAQGGMAEIYRARMASADGAGRLIIIKRIQAGFGANNEFQQMFRSEIKVTMGFNHPNIVQLYDYGEEQQQPYIAMEFVDGKNLRQFLSRFAELKQMFPVEIASYIIEQSASGLHYAHNFKDKITGESLHIVHRDISPQNILISYEGNVKVIDFGIAKAKTNSEATRAGVIKGKPSYLSPEQISCEALDGRCDIFALGIVLWELLTGKKLFAGENDLAVLKLIENCNSHVKPPSTMNPKVPKELDYIVLKALAKQREKRYQTAEELQRALHKFLYAFSPDFNPSDLSYYAKDLFKNDIVEDRKRIQKLNDKVEQLLVSEVAPKNTGVEIVHAGRRDDSTVVTESRSMGGASSGAREGFDVGTVSKSVKVEIDMGPALQTPTPAAPARSSTMSAPTPAASRSGPTAAASRAPQSSRVTATPQPRIPKAVKPKGGGLGKPLVAAAAVVVGLGLFGPEIGIEIPFLTDLFGGGSDARLVLNGDLKGVTVQINGQTKASALPATIKGMPIGTPFQLTVSGAAGMFQQEITLKKGERRQVNVVLAAAAPAGGGQTMAASPETPAAEPAAAVPGGKSILLRLAFSPGGGRAIASINGRPIDGDNPVVAVPLDAPLELVAERSGFRPFRREFVLESRNLGGLKEWMMDVQLEPMRFGFLTIRTTPSAEATILIDGKPWVKKTPLENEKLPVGTYSIKLANEVLGMEKVVKVSIQEGRSINLDERLEIRN